MASKKKETDQGKFVRDEWYTAMGGRTICRRVKHAKMKDNPDEFQGRSEKVVIQCAARV